MQSKHLEKKILQGLKKIVKKNQKRFMSLYFWVMKENI